MWTGGMENEVVEDNKESTYGQKSPNSLGLLAKAPASGTNSLGFLHNQRPVVEIDLLPVFVFP